MRSFFLFLMLAAAPAADGQTPVLTLLNQFERSVESNSSDYFYESGRFYASERVEPNTRGAPGRHRLVAFDAVTGEKAVVTEPRSALVRNGWVRGGYIISVGLAPPAHKVTVVDRQTGEVVGARNLSDDIRDVRVDGDTLHVLQDTGVSRFHLPDMAFLGEAPAPSGLKFTKNGILGLGWDRSRRQILVEFRPFSAPAPVTTAVPEYERTSRMYACGPRLEIANDVHAVIDRGCGHFSVVDIEKGKVLFDVRSFPDSQHAQLALTSKYLFVRPLVAGDVRIMPVSIYDLSTGRELSRQALPAGDLIGVGDVLVVNDDAWRVPRSLRVYAYKVDEAALASYAREAADISAAITRARAANDPYRAAEIIDSVSTDLMMRALDTGVGFAWRDAAAFHARMLALDPGRLGEGVALLDRLSARFPASDQLSADLALARRGAMMFEADAKVREPALAPVWRPAAERPLMQARKLIGDVRVGGLPKAYFSGERAYITCYNCDDGRTTGFHVYDRKTWRRIATVAVAASDTDKQQSVSSLVVGGGKVFVALGTRYREKGDHALFAYDEDTLKLLASWHEPQENPTLYAAGGVVGVYDCNAGGEHGYDVATLDRVGAPAPAAEACERFSEFEPGAPPGSAPEAARRALELGVHAIQASARYLVADAGRYPQRVYRFYRMEGDVTPIESPRAVSSFGAREVYFDREERIAVTIDGGDYLLHVEAFDLATGDYRTLLKMPREKFRGAVSDGRSMFMLFGDSLLAIDMHTGAVLDFADPFEDSAPAQERRNRSIKMLVDGDNLVLLLTESEVGAIIDLGVFHQLADGERTPYAATRRDLMRD